MELESREGDAGSVEVKAKDLTIKDEHDAAWEALSIGNIYGHNSSEFMKKLVSMAPHLDLSKIKNKTDMHLIVEAALWVEHDKPKAIDRMEQVIENIAKVKGISVDEATALGIEIMGIARAMLEMNPLMNDKLKGTRRNVNEDGTFVNAKAMKTLQQIEDETMAKWKKKYSIENYNKKITKILGHDDWNSVDFKNRIERQTVVKEWTPAEMVDAINFHESLAQIRRETMIGKITQKIKDKGKFLSPIVNNSFMRYLNDTSTVRNESLQKWWNDTQFSRKEVQTSADAIMKYTAEKISKSRLTEAQTSRLLFTVGFGDLSSFHANKGEFKVWEKKDLRNLVDGHPDIVEMYKDTIKQISRGMNKKKEKFGHYIGDIKKDMQAKGFSKEEALRAEDVVKAAAILKSASKEDWKALSANKDMMTELQQMVFNQRTFAEKGRKNSSEYDMFWVPTVKKESVNGRGEVDGKASYEIGFHPLKGGAADVTENLTPRDYRQIKSLKKKGLNSREIAQQLEFKTVKGRFVRIKYASDEMAGTSTDASRILAEMRKRTEENTVEKEIVNRMLDDAKNENLVFSKTLKKGFVEIPKDRLGRLNTALIGKELYIREELVDTAIGQKGLLLTNSENRLIRVSELIYKELVQNFKAMVTLGNPSSWVNNALYGVLVNWMAGVETKGAFAKQKLASKEINRAFVLREQLAIRKARGVSTSKLEAEIEKIGIIQAERDGLAIGLIDGIAGTNKVLGTVIEKMIGDGAVHAVVKNVGLQGGSKTRDMLNKGFTVVDGAGRYSLYMHYKEIGMSGVEAAKKANSLYGDSRVMSPTFVRFIDEYGIVPFLKWFTTVAPGILKTTIDNPGRALSLTAGVMALGGAMNIRTSGYNPVEGLVDFGNSLEQDSTPVKAAKLGYKKYKKEEIKDYETNFATPYFIPSAYYKTYRLAGQDKDLRDWFGMVIPERTRISDKKENK